jgi:hypothetical protein
MGSAYRFGGMELLHLSQLITGPTHCHLFHNMPTGSMTSHLCRLTILYPPRCHRPAPSFHTVTDRVPPLPPTHLDFFISYTLRTLTPFAHKTTLSAGRLKPLLAPDLPPSSLALTEDSPQAPFILLVRNTFAAYSPPTPITL